MNEIYRQGDVLIVRVAELPLGLTQEKGPVILAHGEATGHVHRIKTCGTKLFNGAAGRFLRVSKVAVVEHQEHAPIELPPGVYEVRRQREYSPEEIRTVAD